MMDEAQSHPVDCETAARMNLQAFLLELVFANEFRARDPHELRIVAAEIESLMMAWPCEGYSVDEWKLNAGLVTRNFFHRVRRRIDLAGRPAAR